MPPSGSRGHVSANKERASSGLYSYYCCCREFALVTNKHLALLPRRKTDGAIILRNTPSDTAARQIYKLNCSTDAKPVLVRREANALEKQWRLRCNRCDLPIGYQVREPKAVKQKLVKESPFTYILAGSLTDHQDQLPEGAFDLEPWKVATSDQQENTSS